MENEQSLLTVSYDRRSQDMIFPRPLFPPLVALASYCAGTSLIKGVSRLAHKESDRGVTLQEEFGKMGIEVRI